MDRGRDGWMDKRIVDRQLNQWREIGQLDVQMDRWVIFDAGKWIDGNCIGRC